jgi:hypothetical protein
LRHLRLDYDRIQDPATIAPHLAQGRPFGADELVFLLRARDKNAATVVAYWADLTEEDGGDPELVSAARRWADAMHAQGQAIGTKVPDTPPELLRSDV